MVDLLLDTVIDSLKLAIFLYITFLIIEYLESKIDSEKIIKKVGNKGPFVGSLLGAFPQCGFSVSATNFYITHIISLGTLMAVYLSTSDEMLPILIANGLPVYKILIIIGIKVIIGMIFGFTIDAFLLKKKKPNLHALCDEKCDCENENIFLAALKHTINTIIFIFIISLVLNIALDYLDLTAINNFMNNNRVLSPLVSSLLGLIPNCGSSIMITELYLNNMMSFGTMMAGLLTGSGVGILVLFKNNKNLKENLTIVGLLYFIGVLIGIIINFF